MHVIPAWQTAGCGCGSFLSQFWLDPLQILDVFQCVERLNELDAMSLRKLVQRERMLAVPRLEKLLPFKVDLVELLTRLPLHLMACILAQEPRENGRLLPVCTITTKLTCRAHTRWFD